jgi:hypothetical protein
LSLNAFVARAPEAAVERASKQTALRLEEV